MKQIIFGLMATLYTTAGFAGTPCTAEIQAKLNTLRGTAAVLQSAESTVLREINSRRMDLDRVALKSALSQVFSQEMNIQNEVVMIEAKYDCE